MKKFFTASLTVIVMTITAFAQITISLPDVTASPGESLLIPVTSGEVTSGDLVYFFQFCVYFDPDVVIIEEPGYSYTGAFTPTAWWNSTVCNISYPDSIILGAYSFAAPLTGSGTLINLMMQVPETATGSTDLSFAYFMYNDPGSPPEVVTTNGSITVLSSTLALHPEELDFGIIECGGSLGQNLQVFNVSSSTVIIYAIETTNSVFTTDFTPDDSLLAAGDSLELTVTFAPDNTVDYNDTLFVYSSVDTVYATLSGEGIASLILAEPDSLDFFSLELGMDSTMALLFHNEGNDTLIFDEITTSDPVFTVDFPTIGENILPGGTSDTCWITFTPEEEILYEDTLFILCNAFNAVNDTFSVYLRGEGGIVPDTVRNLTIEAVYPDAVLNWDAVTTSIYGSPITVDCYLIFFSEESDGEFYFLAMTIDTTYTHEYVVQFSENMFYFVEAYIGEIGFLEEITAQSSPLSKDELDSMLEANR